jgi:chemotaxis response regulator CheB
MATVSYVDDSRDVAAMRVLVVEDFEPFRQFIRSKLAEKPELQVIGEVSDGEKPFSKPKNYNPT